MAKCEQNSSFGNDSKELELKYLQDKITQLEEENQRLKKLLDKAGILYEHLSMDDDDIQEVFDPNQGGRIQEVTITDELANRFF